MMYTSVSHITITNSHLPAGPGENGDMPVFVTTGIDDGMTFSFYNRAHSQAFLKVGNESLTFMYSSTCVLNAGDSCSPLAKKHEKPGGNRDLSSVRWGLYS